MLSKYFKNTKANASLNLTTIEQGRMHFFTYVTDLAVAAKNSLWVRNLFKKVNKSDAEEDGILTLFLDPKLVTDVTVYENRTNIQDVTPGTAVPLFTYNRKFPSTLGSILPVTHSNIITNPGDVLIPTIRLGTESLKQNEIGAGNVGSTSHPLIIGPEQNLLIEFENVDSDINTISFSGDLLLEKDLSTGK